MPMTMYVGNLPFSADQLSLKSLFSPFGEVLSAKVMTDRDTGRSRGFGFVEMESDAAKKAITELDGKDFEGRPLRVNESQPRARR
jgi:RNA recognition motif-containing protein